MASAGASRKTPPCEDDIEYEAENALLAGKATDVRISAIAGAGAIYLPLCPAPARLKYGRYFPVITILYIAFFSMRSLLM